VAETKKKLPGIIEKNVREKFETLIAQDQTGMSLKTERVIDILW